MAMHYGTNAETVEYLLLSADLEHCETDISLQLRDGLWIVDGMVAVDSWRNAHELVTEDAA